MDQHHDRRVSGVQRVPVERIVDVCGHAAPSSAFQGRSVDVSGRGMQVRAKYLPELHAPLVLRFQEQGGEVIAEGEVAWRKEGVNGGEFGVRFTALDSRSVQALKALCQGARGAAFETLDGPGREPSDTDHDTEPVPAAVARVQLHIAGMGSPMQAHIKEQTSRRIEVGSPLEFLRVGRSLQIEDLSLGGRRDARIDAVDVAIDGDSHVPELVVSLRYADQPDTPQPPKASLVKAALAKSAPPIRVEVRKERRPAPEPFAGEALPVEDDLERSEDSLRPEPLRTDVPAVHRAARPGSAARRPLFESEDDLAELDPAAPADAMAASRHAEPGPTPGELRVEFGGDEDDDETSEAERLRQRMATALSGMSSAARTAGEQLERFGGAASRGATWLWSRAQRVRAVSAAPLTQRRRTAAAPPSALRPRSLRPNPRSLTGREMGSDGTSATAARRRMQRLLVGGGLALLALVGLSLGRGGSVAQAPARGPAGVSSVPAAPSNDTGNPGTTVHSEPASPPPGASSPPSGGRRPAFTPDENPPEDPTGPPQAVAQVPLYGPGSPAAADGAAVRAIERPLARSKAADQTFDDDLPRSRPRVALTTEFARGRLHLPVVYRLRLDQPASSLRGEQTPTGFDVIIPGRKVMETGADITRHDDRIAKVLTRKGSEGSRVSFHFRHSIPSYKVRLRKDFVEFFISSRD